MKLHAGQIDNPNRVPPATLDVVAWPAGLLEPGRWMRAPGGWARVTSARIAPDHAAVIVLELDGDPKPRRYHCDEAVAVLRQAPQEVTA